MESVDYSELLAMFIRVDSAQGDSSLGRSVTFPALLTRYVMQLLTERLPHGD